MQVSLGVLEATILGDQFSWLKIIKFMFEIIDKKKLTGFEKTYIFILFYPACIWFHSV